MYIIVHITLCAYSSFEEIFSFNVGKEVLCSGLYCKSSHFAQKYISLGTSISLISFDLFLDSPSHSLKSPQETVVNDETGRISLSFL